MSWIPEDTKVEAATLWAATRNWNLVSELTGISVAKLKKLKEEPFWENVVSRVVKDKNDVLDAELTGIIHKCAEQIQERLTKGDPRVNYKTGEIYEVPLDARGLAMVMGILFDKRQLVRGEATSRTETISADKRLEQLQSAFIKFSQATQIEGKRLDEKEQKEDAGQGQQEALLIEQADFSEGSNGPPSQQEEFDSPSPLQEVK